MKRLLLVLGLLFAPSGAFACDTYASVKSDTRTITYNGDWDAGFTLTDKGKTRHFSFWDAGAGTKTIVGVPDDKAGDNMQIKTPHGAFWFGPERFMERCK